MSVKTVPVDSAVDSMLQGSQFHMLPLLLTWFSSKVIFSMVSTMFSHVMIVAKNTLKFYSDRTAEMVTCRIGPDFLVNVNSRSRSLYAIARPSVVCHLSVVCNTCAPYSGGSNFWAIFLWH